LAGSDVLAPLPLGVPLADPEPLEALASAVDALPDPPLDAVEAEVALSSLLLPQAASSEPTEAAATAPAPRRKTLLRLSADRRGSTD
jgi:hypothetical protein